MGAAAPKDQKSLCTLRHVGAMLALFFAVWRFLGVFCTSCCVCGRSWSVLSRHETLRARFWRARDAFWKLRTSIFRCFFALEHAHCCDAANATKPQFLQCLPPVSVILRILRHVPKHVIKLVQGRVEQSFPQRSCRKLVLELAGLGFGGVRTSFGWLFGATWPAFGRSWVPPGLSWTLLGHTLGASGAILGLSCVVWNGFSLPMASRT